MSPTSIYCMIWTINFQTKKTNLSVFCAVFQQKNVTLNKRSHSWAAMLKHFTVSIYKIFQNPDEIGHHHFPFNVCAYSNKNKIITINITTEWWVGWDRLCRVTWIKLFFNKQLCIIFFHGSSSEIFSSILSWSRCDGIILSDSPVIEFYWDFPCKFSICW